MEGSVGGLHQPGAGMPKLAKEAGATEELKASDPMKWVGLMNTCKAQAEEILMAELINS